MSHTFEIYNKETEKIQYEDSAYRTYNISFELLNDEHYIIRVICDTLDFRNENDWNDWEFKIWRITLHTEIDTTLEDILKMFYCVSIDDFIMYIKKVSEEYREDYTVSFIA